jgi:hypothetical protein
MAYKTLLAAGLIVVSVLGRGESSWAAFVIHSHMAGSIELYGYNGLTDSSLFKGSISTGSYREIKTPYRGLALLVFESGQSYPVIIGDEPVTLKIINPDVPPAFTAGSENEFFYKALSGGNPAGELYGFALLMLEAKQLLESSHAIHTIEDLAAKKKQMHDFVRIHYGNLKYSDMVRRLIAQYFMMHEYVDYHIEGAPATDIKIKYHQEIIHGVEKWLEILKDHLPDHEILNYCVSLYYYDRSMVALAVLIIENFRDVAYCPGDENKTFSFLEDLRLTDADRNKERRLNEFKGNKIIAFVSDDCPVSMVETVSKARKLSEQKEDVTLIVVPLQDLSEKHLAMNKLVSGGDMLFVNDTEWQQEHLIEKIRLPFFDRIKASVD